jgi:hypothetical protein
MVLAIMLSTITICKAKDENGQDIVPEIAFELGLAAYVVFRSIFSYELQVADHCLDHGASFRSSYDDRCTPQQTEGFQVCDHPTVGESKISRDASSAASFLNAIGRNMQCRTPLQLLSTVDVIPIAIFNVPSRAHAHVR